MTDPELLTLYEKFYFNEVERREKIGARLTIPMALLLAASSFLGYMVKISPESNAGTSAIFFWIFFDLSALSWVVSAWHFRGAWANRLSDKLMPTAIQIEGYRDTLIKTYASYENSETLVAKELNYFLKNYYMEASSTNAILNDRRSFSINDSSIAIALCMALGVGAYIALTINLNF